MPQFLVQIQSSHDPSFFNAIYGAHPIQKIRYSPDSVQSKSSPVLLICSIYTLHKHAFLPDSWNYPV